MKTEKLIMIVALLIVVIIVVKFVIPNNKTTDNTTEENKVAYRYEIEDQNFTEIDQNIVEPVDATVNVQNVIDVTEIENLRRSTNN